MHQLILAGLLLVGTTVTSQQQQCRFVPVCDEGQRPDGSFLKGDKGDVGNPGKMGPHGPQGQNGEPGPLANTTALMSLVTSLLDKVEKQGILLYQTTKRLEEIHKQVIPVSCKNALLRGRQTLRSGDEVYCVDGWQVFQHRYDGSESFNRLWEDYKHGFGNLSSEFWLGLEKLHQITSSARKCRLRIDIWDFAAGHAFAEYSDFRVGNGVSSHQLALSGYSGTAGNSMLESSLNQNGMRFSTADRDNDLYSQNCGADYGGPWWHNACGYARLNGPWSSTSADHNSMSWYHWKNTWGGIKSSMMKVQCDD